MPYCEKHNEVYSGPTCPVCAGDDAEDSPETGHEDTSNTVEEIVEEATDKLPAEADIHGDAVVGNQQKEVTSEDVMKIDRSETRIDESTEVNDHSTNVTDSVVNRSDIGDDGTNEGDVDDTGGEAAAVNDSIVNRSDIDDNTGGSSNEPNTNHRSPRHSGGRAEKQGDKPTPEGGTECPSCETTVSGDQITCPDCGLILRSDGYSFCTNCGSELPEAARKCPACGERIEGEL